jgi:micrococcal nuclease
MNRDDDEEDTSSADPYPGYTGPRCYLPGGKTYRPC